MSKLEQSPHKSDHNPAFARRNIIADEIEKAIDALASQGFRRPKFLKKLDHFYLAIEHPTLWRSSLLPQGRCGFFWPCLQRDGNGIVSGNIKHSE